MNLSPKMHGLLACLLPVRVIDATLCLRVVPPPRLSTAETSPSGLRRQTPCSPVRVPLVCNGPSQFSTGLCALAATLAALCEACPNQLAAQAWCSSTTSHQSEGGRLGLKAAHARSLRWGSVPSSYETCNSTAVEVLLKASHAFAEPVPNPARTSSVGFGDADTLRS